MAAADIKTYRCSDRGALRCSDGKSVVATFFLIRYQRVVASSREINFARQLFRISLFISAVQKDFGNALPECLRAKTALDSSPMTD